MTAQSPDILIHRGEELDLCGTPLAPYLARLPKARRPNFVATSTALWRGYVATWEVVGRRLLLMSLDGVVKTDDGFAEVDLTAAFPWRRGPIPATWVTDVLRCPEGRLRSYVHAGFASAYEREREFHVRRGEFEGEFLIYNPPPPLVYAISPDGGRTCQDGDTRRLEDTVPDPFAENAPVEPWRLWGDPNWGFEGGDGYQVLAQVTGIHHLRSSRRS